jgi:hypothetical protein
VRAVRHVRLAVQRDLTTVTGDWRVAALLVLRHVEQSLTREDIEANMQQAGAPLHVLGEPSGEPSSADVRLNAASLRVR